MPLRNFPLLHNWKAKLGSLALATVLWLIIKQSVNRSYNPPPLPSPAAETVPRE